MVRQVWVGFANWQASRLGHDPRGISGFFGREVENRGSTLEIIHEEYLAYSPTDSSSEIIFHQLPKIGKEKVNKPKHEQTPNRIRSLRSLTPPYHVNSTT